MRFRINTRLERRLGNVLVLFALLVFVLLAFTALAIDTGLALLARRQMQAAVSPAALEGLRFRDELPSFADATLSPEEARRQAARRMAAWVFDDDFNPDNGDAL